MGVTGKGDLPANALPLQSVNVTVQTRWSWDSPALGSSASRLANVLPVVFLSGAGDIPTTVQAMRQGAEDFLTKDAPKEAIFAAVDRAIARDARQRAENAHLHALRARFDALTSRRPYKTPWPNTEAFAYLRRQAEGKLDRDCGEPLIPQKEAVERIQATFAA